jgi:hypothetical protein
LSLSDQIRDNVIAFGILSYLPKRKAPYLASFLKPWCGMLPQACSQIGIEIVASGHANLQALCSEIILIV